LRERHERGRLGFARHTVFLLGLRGVDVGDTWTEGDRDLVKVRFTANLLDYTVDETSGDIKDGSSSVPVRFEEDWIFAKARTSNRWHLAGIEQI
jgi:predicted lipid-binding transport protein (Tim44 family)